MYGATINEDESRLAILLEYAPGKDLEFLLLPKNMVKFELNDAMHWTRQVAKALSYIHSLKTPLVHRDLKPENVFMKIKDGEVIALLGDFGLAKPLDGPGETTTGQMAGTVTFMAPEVFTPEPYGKNVDVFSLGCTVNALVARKLPSKRQSDYIIDRRNEVIDEVEQAELDPAQGWHVGSGRIE